MPNKNWKNVVNAVTVKHKTENKLKVKKNVQEKISFKEWIIQSFKHFCSETALHGYCHVVRDDTALWEKIFWAVTAISASIIALLLLYLSYSWNAITPTVTVIESTHYATSNIPFPAVTFCGANKISAKAALTKANSMKRPSNLSGEDLADKFRLLYHFDNGEAPDSEYNLLHEVLQANSLNIDQLIYDIAPSCKDMTQRCIWKGTQTRCETLFQTIKTTIGICCSFNYRGLAKPFYQTKTTSNIPTIPRRITACGYTTGLSVLIQPQLPDYHTTLLGTIGTRILIHSAYDFADENAETKLVAPNLEGFISLSPEATYSTDDIYKLPKEERHCISPTEVQLNVFQRYSYVNCLAECRSDIIFQLCKCIPYTLPNNGSRPVCQMNQIKCVRENEIYFQPAIPGINQTITYAADGQINYPCGCYPDCELLQYPSEISSGAFSRKFSFNSMGFFKDIVIDNQTLLHIFFKDLVSTYYRRDMFQNWLSILGSFGGLLGLFLGFSLITGFELIYFFSLRAVFDKIAPKKRSKPKSITATIKK